VFVILASFDAAPEFALGRHRGGTARKVTRAVF